MRDFVFRKEIKILHDSPDIHSLRMRGPAKVVAKLPRSLRVALAGDCTAVEHLRYRTGYGDDSFGGMRPGADKLPSWGTWGEAEARHAASVSIG